jgi:hypothetical protein
LPELEGAAWAADGWRQNATTAATSAANTVIVRFKVGLLGES